MLRKLVYPLLGLSLTTNVFAQNKPVEEEKMEWFDDAKLGIFIHWGIYSVDGISESWAFFNNYINHANYLKQLDGFTAAQYDPKEWVSLIKDSGAKYTVITSKHHDGISLWDSKQDKAITTKNNAAAKKDVLTPFISEVKKSGLKTGIYYSLPDWSHPYYDIVTRTQKRYDLKNEPKRWSDFVTYYQGQLTELSKQYKPDLLWFDGDWEHSAEEWKADKTMNLLRSYNPNIIVNSRLNHHGDYATPEQGIPVKRPQDRYWELCYTMNDSWGYQHFDTHYKTPNMIVRTLVDCISMGGNLLLDIGPKADGTIPAEQVAILKELGRWTNLHKEAIYGTRAGLDNKFTLEKTAFSKDGKTLFVYLDNVKDLVSIQGLETKPSKVRFLNGNEEVSTMYDGYNLGIKLDNQKFDKAVSVIAIDFAEKPVFALRKGEMTTSVDRITKMNNATEAARYIAKWTASGANLFAGKLNDDGSKMDASLKFTSKDVENWVKKHAEVLTDAQEGINPNHYAGYSALSKDRQTLYLFVEGKPTGPIAIKGLKNGIARIRIVGEGSMIGHEIYNKLYWSAVPGIVYIDVPQERLDKEMTVIAVLLDKPIDLYQEEVKAIESNL